ncbi:CBS domain-containing protein CBSX2, chloroplastic-like [Olea europaea var. sylvestris]|uniref:CBS domain-containing protein CBSX2, chloroplastic-like n=1 Tax=Olea europaea var. sylvestris TaxID=158386 RepID=UPI000C1D1AF2|nr:CBS domain-containing protein CBSX2, chloroplastic-like [Olea europaea var. sylvestris]
MGRGKRCDKFNKIGIAWGFRLGEELSEWFLVEQSWRVEITQSVQLSSLMMIPCSVRECITLLQLQLTKVGVVSDYDLLALDSISGGGQHDTNMFPDVDSSWKTFNEIQKLLNKTYGKVVGDLMTDAPLVVRENTNLEDAVRLLLLTKYHRLPVVDGSSKLVGIITRGDVVRAALQIKRASEKM